MRREPTEQLDEQVQKARATLSPPLLALLDEELAAGNSILRIDEGLWSACPLAVNLSRVMRAVAPDRLTANDLEWWECRDPHYELQAGVQCRKTRHCLAGPLEENR